MHDLFTGDAAQIVAAGFFVGIIVGITGMGGGALMTPALIFLGVGNTSSIVTADLTAAAVYKSGGALMHSSQGSPNFRLAGWLIAGSVPMAFLGPHLVSWFVDKDEVENLLKECIGFALLLAASTYAIRLYIQLRAVRRGTHPGGSTGAGRRSAPSRAVCHGVQELQDPQEGRGRCRQAAGGCEQSMSAGGHADHHGRRL